MKTRFLLTALIGILMCSTVANAQAIISKGAESKKIEPSMMDEGGYAGEYNGLSCWVTQGRRHSKQVLLIDRNMQVQRAMQLKYDGECEVLATTINGRRLTMLTADRSQRRRTLVYTAEVDLDSMVSMLPGGDFVLTDSIGYGRRDVCHLWVKSSPNRRYTGYINIVEYVERKQYSVQIAMLGSNLRPLWTTEYALGTLDEMCVGDDGTIATLGYENIENQTVLTVNVIDSSRAVTYEVLVKGEPIRTMNIAGLVDRKLIGIGTYRPVGHRTKEDVCGGVVALAVGIDSGNLAGFSMRRFTNEDIDIFLNKKTKKIQSDLYTSFIGLEAITTTPWGAVAVMGRNVLQSTVEANGVERTKAIRTGLHVVAVDADGNIEWVRNLRRNDHAKKDDIPLAVNIATLGNDALLFKSESPKFPATYDIANEAAEMTAGDKSNLVYYRLAPSGDVSKTIIEAKTKHALLSAKQIAHDDILLYTAAGSRTRVAELKIR